MALTLAFIKPGILAHKLVDFFFYSIFISALKLLLLKVIDLFKD